MFDIGDRVKVTKGFYEKYLKEYLVDYNLTYDSEYIIEEDSLDDDYCEIKNIDSGWRGAVEVEYLIKIEDRKFENISQKSINSTMEELYEMIIKENCSRELQGKFWDLHRVLSSKEKEVKIRLEEINKILWE